VIDLHTHLLPGVDDGPASMEESVALARVAEAAGIDTLVATPHVSFDVPTTPAAIESAVIRVRERLAAEGVAVRVLAGGEIAAGYGAGLDDVDLRRLRLGGGEWLLLECPLTRSAPGFELVARALQARGHRILLAHPERSPALRRQPALLRGLVDEGMLASITAGSLVGRFGGEVRDFALTMLEAGVVHNVTSDAHDAIRRAPGLRVAVLAADAELPGLADQLDWLTRDVPAAILGGGPVPSRPGASLRRRRGRVRLLRRRSRAS
jgi:protein-tyrosine phosphatase